MSGHEKDRARNLRQKLLLCSFSALSSQSESLDNVSQVWDERLWPVPALFHAGAVGEQGFPPGARGET
jgi:hypothetical protein